MGDENSEEAEEADMVDGGTIERGSPAVKAFADELGLDSSSDDESEDEKKVDELLMKELASSSDEGGNKHATNTTLF